MENLPENNSLHNHLIETMEQEQFELPTIPQVNYVNDMFQSYDKFKHVNDNIKQVNDNIKQVNDFPEHSAPPPPEIEQVVRYEPFDKFGSLMYEPKMKESSKESSNESNQLKLTKGSVEVCVNTNNATKLELNGKNVTVHFNDNVHNGKVLGSHLVQNSGFNCWSMLKPKSRSNKLTMQLV
jgi:hypothetical protein